MKKKKDVKLFIPKYSVKLQDFISDKIEEGMTLAEVCREYGPPNHDVVPNEKTCYRWKKKYPAFKKALDDAYQILIFKMMDEMNDLSKEIRNLDRQWEVLEEEIEDKMGTEDELDPSQVRSRCNAIMFKTRDKRDSAKVRLKALEFMLTKIAPKLVNDLKDQSPSMNVNLPPINIINYSDVSEPSNKGLLTYGKEENNK